MNAPKPKPPVGKNTSAEPSTVKRDPAASRRLNFPFRDSEPLRKLQSDLHKNSKRKDA